MCRKLLTALLLVRVAHSIIIRSSPSQIHLEQRIQTVTKTPPSFFFLFCFNVSGRHASGLICARKVPQKGTAKPLSSGLRESLWSAVCVNLRCKTTGDPGSSWGSFLFYFFIFARIVFVSEMPHCGSFPQSTWTGGTSADDTRFTRYCWLRTLSDSCIERSWGVKTRRSKSKKDPSSFS